MFRAEMSPASCRKCVLIFAPSNEAGKINIAPIAEGGTPVLPWVAYVAIYLAVARVNGAALKCLRLSRVYQLRKNLNLSLRQQGKAMKRLGDRIRYIRDREAGERLGDLKHHGRGGHSLAERAWLAEKEWRAEKKLDIGLHRYVRRKGERRFPKRGG